MGKIRIGIVGYGNLGRGVESGIRQNPDMELVAVFTRRDPVSLQISTSGVKVCRYEEIESYKGSIDVMVLCGGSATDLICQTPEIARHFKFTLGRPEILNRIGENIIVFDFIREPVAREIFTAMLSALLSQVQAAQGIVVRVTPQAEAVLREMCLADLTNGGRGIRNQLEVHLVNPLARVLFEANLPSGAVLEITEVRRAAVTELLWKPAQREGHRCS